MGVLKKIFTWWDGPTIGTALNTRRFGSKVGSDDAGNIYYEGKDGRRWVSYNGANDAARIPPEWHSWMHHTVDVLPADLPQPVLAWEKPWQPNATGTPLAYFPSGSLNDTGRRARATGDYEAWTPEGPQLANDSVDEAPAQLRPR